MPCGHQPGRWAYQGAGRLPPSAAGIELPFLVVDLVAEMVATLVPATDTERHAVGDEQVLQEVKHTPREAEEEQK